MHSTIWWYHQPPTVTNKFPLRPQPERKRPQNIALTSSFVQLNILSRGSIVCLLSFTLCSRPKSPLEAAVQKW
uniref:Uncharacterized protein n=1 Tax=Pararge aegeria TaxID=116150 RepID=S4P9P4_9NEOP